MKKFFKFGSSKKTPGNVQGHTSPHRRSLVSIGSSVSDSENVGWGSFSSNVDPSKGYQIDPGRDKSLTKLHKACWTGDLGSVKKHIKKIDINQVDSESRTPLHLAATRAHKDVIWFLLGSKAKPNLPDIDGNTPLLKAVQCGHAGIVQFLLERGADPKAADFNGNTGLHHVASNGQQDIAFSLIQKGADINAKNEDGVTALTISTIHRQLDMTELLLRHGASLNISDKEQKTCLMFACEKGYSEIVQIFVQHGVDENMTNAAGHTAVDIAKFAGHDDCVSILNNFRVRRDSVKKDLQEQQMNETHDIRFASDEQNKASQMDVNADFNDSDIDSWNDDASEASTKKDPRAGVNLSKFLTWNTDHSEKSDLNLADNHLASVKDLQGVNGSKNVKDEPNKDSGETARSQDCEESVVDAPLAKDNESGQSLQKSEISSENMSENRIKKDRDFLADLGLSDNSEVSTPTFSGFSMKDEAHKDADTDVEDDKIPYDNPAVAVEDKETSLVKVHTEENIDIKAVDATFFEEKESNAPLTRASQNMGSLQTVYFSVKKDGSFNKDDSDTDWDDESKEDDVEGPIHIHPILLQKKPQVESNSSEMLEECVQDSHFKKKEIGSVPLLDSSLPSLSSTKKQNLEETNDALYPVLIETSTNFSSNVISNQGTLGRPGTMHEVEEMWVKNPSVEIVKEAIQSTATYETQIFVKENAQVFANEEIQHFVEEDAQPVRVKEAQSMVKRDYINDVDNIYHAELAMVNSQENSKSNTLDGQHVGNISQITLPNDADFKNSEVISVEQRWDQIWLQIWGKLRKENDTDSSDEISSVAITDQENKDSFSSADVDQSVASAQDDALPYQLLISFLKDPNCGRKVIDLIQHLRLSWQKEQDKSKILVQNIKLLKSEAQKNVAKNQALNASKVDAENAMHHLEMELESAKHALKIQENMRENVELELDRRKNQVLAMEEKLLQEVAARQHAELLSKANLEETQTNHELMLQLSTQIPNKVASLADFECQTDESPSNNNQIHNLELISLRDEKAKLEGLNLSLKQHMDLLAVSLAQQNIQQSKLEDQLNTVQKELSLKAKESTESDLNLTETKRKYSIKVENEKMLNKRLEELQKDCLRLSSEIITSEDNNVKVSKNLAVAINNLEECNLKIALLESEIETLKAKEDRLQMSLKVQMNENDQQRQEITDLQKRLIRLQSDNSKVTFELDNGNKLQQLVLDQEETQNQIIKAKEEKYIAIVSENEALKHQIEEFKGQDLLNVQKVNVLTEKLLHANAYKTEVADLQSQLTVASNKSSVAEMKVAELRKKLQEEQSAGLKFLTVEKELEETSKKLNLAKDTIATIEKLLAMAQENEKNHENQLQNELEVAKIQLLDAGKKVKELSIEFNEKDRVIQDLTLKLERQNSKNSLFAQNVDHGEEVQDLATNSVNDWLEDVDGAADQDWQEIHNSKLPSLKFSKYVETLEQLKKQVDELKKQSMKDEEVLCNDKSVAGNLNAGGGQPTNILTGEFLSDQGKTQQKEYEVLNKDHKQQLSTANGLPKHALQMENIQNRLDESANSLRNSVDDVNIQFMRQSWEVGARRELNQQLNKINIFLEERTHASEHLELLQKEREIRLHRDYQRAVRDLKFEVRQLHDELYDKEYNRRALEEQNQHRRKLNEARKRVKAKLQDHGKKKTSMLEKHLRGNHPSRLKDPLFASSTQEYATSSLTSFHGLSPSVPGSPIINNLRSFKDLEGALSAKLGFDQEPIFAQQLSGSAVFDSQYKSNLNLSLDKTTSEYLDVLKKNYLL